MNTAEILKRVQNTTSVTININEDGPAPTLVVSAENILSVMSCLKETGGLDFDTLMSQTAVHEKDELILFWHLYSYTHKHELAVESRVPVLDPKVSSVVSLWSGADWLERETYDLFGVIFEGHPDLRRIMMPPDWEGHPLLKDYETPTSYQDIDNTPSEITQSFQVKAKEGI